MQTMHTAWLTLNMKLYSDIEGKHVVHTCYWGGSWKGETFKIYKQIRWNERLGLLDKNNGII